MRYEHRYGGLNVVAPGHRFFFLDKLLSFPLDILAIPDYNLNS